MNGYNRLKRKTNRGLDKGLLSAIATEYGVVISGEYAKCKMGLGNDHGKVLEVGNGKSNQLLFIKGFKEVARIYTKDVAETKTLSDDNRQMTVEITWKDGKKSTVQISKLNSQGKYDARKVGDVLAALSAHE